MRSKSYRLAQYCIIETSNEEIWWETHGGLGSLKRGKCFIQGDILFIGPSESEESSFLKREFLEKLRNFPQWNKTKYYCSRYSIHECHAEKGEKKSIQVEPAALDLNERHASPATGPRFSNEVLSGTQSHTAAIGNMAAALLDGLRSVTSRLNKVKFRKSRLL